MNVVCGALEARLGACVVVPAGRDCTSRIRGTEAQLGAGAGNFIPLSDVKHYMELDGNEVHIRIELAN